MFLSSTRGTISEIARSGQFRKKHMDSMPLPSGDEFDLNQSTSKALLAELADNRAPKAESSAKSYIPTLDGWRAIAVSLVICAHSYTMLMNNGTKVARLFANFFSHAGYGVDIFFALSGYLICTLLLREKQRNATISLPRFYVRRAFRILPPILLFLLIMVLLSHTGILPHIDTHEILAVLFFYRNYLLGSWYTGHFWSLAVEEQFYAVIPFFLLLANRQWAVRIASVLIALCIGIRWFEFTYGWFSGSILQFRTENRFDGLLWGCLFAMALQSTAIRAWLQRRLTGWIFLAMMAAVVVLLVAFNSQPARRTVVAAFMPFFIGYTVLHPASFAGRILELPLLKWVGRLSYSLYIWQSVFLVPDERPLRVLQAFPLNLVCPLVCASLSYYILEKPMIKIGHRLAASRGEKPTGRFD